MKQLDEFSIKDDLRKAMNIEVDRLLLQHRHSVESRNIAKLSRLYGRSMELSQQTSDIINLLPDHRLTPDKNNSLSRQLKSTPTK